MVPVIRDADRKTFGEIEQEIASLATKAREGKLALSEIQGAPSPSLTAASTAR